MLVKSGDLKNLAKRNGQRTAAERQRVTRGLLRSLLLECLVFVPASAILLLLLAPLMVSATTTTERIRAVHVLLGIVSYGFPFATVRTIVTRTALNTLKEFANLTPGTVDEDNV